MKRLLKIFGFTAAAMAFLFGVALLVFYHLIRVGEFRRFLAGQFEELTHLKVQMGEAEVELGRIVGVSFRDFALLEPESGRVVIRAPKILARVALPPLFQKRLVFYGLSFYQPALQVIRDPEGNIPLTDLLLNMPFQKQERLHFTLDLREIRVEKGEVTFVDYQTEKSPDVTHFQAIDLTLHKHRARTLESLGIKLPSTAANERMERAVDFKFKMSAERERRRTNLSSSGKILFPNDAFGLKQAWVDADVETDYLPAVFLQEYLARLFPIEAVRGILGSRLHWEGSLAGGAKLKGEIRYKNLEVDAPSLFTDSLTPGEGKVRFAADWKPREIRFQRVDLSSKGLALSLNGSLRSLDRKDPHLNFQLTSSFAPLAGVRRYIPFKAINSPRLENLTGIFHQGDLKIIKAGFSGKLSELRRLSEPGFEDRLWLDAEVRGAGGSFGADRALPLTGFSGRIVLEKGVLSYRDFKGMFGQSRLTYLEGTHREALTGAGTLELRVKGDMDLGQLPQQMQTELFPPSARKLAGELRDLGGKSRLDLLLRTDFGAFHDYEGTLSLEGARLRVGDFPLSQFAGEIQFSPAEIRADRADGLLAGSPVRLKLLLKNFAADHGTFDLTIDSSAFKASEALHVLLPLGSYQGPGLLRGAVRYQGSLNAPENRKFTGSFELVGAEVPFKFLTQPLREVNGRVRIDGKTIDLQGVRAQAGGYGFSLNGRWMGGERPTLLFSLSAPVMDVAYLLPREVSRDEEWYKRLQIRGKLSLDKGRYETFTFSDLKTDLALEKRVWRLANFSALSLGGTVEGSGSFLDVPENPQISIEPEIRGVPVNEVLTWFDMGTSEIGGKLNLSGKFDFNGKKAAERKRNVNGAFHVQIEDGVARRFQALVRVLNFLDLSRWFSLKLPDAGQEGVRFRTASADFKVAHGVYSTQNLYVDGDDLRITGAGELDGPKGELDFTVAVRPFPGIDNAANYIPILGTGLAAIKNSLLVASFNVKGPIEDPSITAAPLSTLTEFFFGALAIPKGLIGLPVGERK